MTKPHIYVGLEHWCDDEDSGTYVVCCSTSLDYVVTQAVDEISVYEDGGKFINSLSFDTSTGVWK